MLGVLMVPPSQLALLNTDYSATVTDSCDFDNMGNEIS